MNLHPALTPIAALALAFTLGACGAGDREIEDDAPALPASATTTSTESATPDLPPGTETGADAAEMASATGAAESAAPTAQPTTQPLERLYTVQLAAYLSTDSARALAARLTERGLPVWTMEVRVGQRTYHRVRIGAHPRLGEMRRLGEELSTRYSQEVWVAPIDMATQIPVNAVEATRALLQR